jgi:hypothetical protein
MKKPITLALLLAFIIPQIAFASWYNPFSWSIWNIFIGNNSQTEMLQKKVDDLESKLNNTKQSPIESSTTAVISKTQPLIKTDVVVKNGIVSNPVVASTVNQNTPVIISSPEILKPVQTPINTPTPDQQPVAPVQPKVDSSTDYGSLINFATMSKDEAMGYIQPASDATGVPADFLYKVLRLEYPTNQGVCYLINSTSGLLSDGISVMKPSRDLKPFYILTRDLGVDPSKVAVSCKGGLIGGFIPSVWDMFSNGKILNPWNPMDVALIYATYLEQPSATFNEAHSCSTIFGKSNCPF